VSVRFGRESGGRLRLPLNLPHDTALFLGGKKKTTLKDLSESLGKETIDLLNHSVTKGNSPSFGENFQKLGKELMSIDELSVLDGGKCILQLRGVRPFLSDKYDITKHKNYRHLSDFDENNAFNMERFVNRKMKVNGTQPTNTRARYINAIINSKRRKGQNSAPNRGRDKSGIFTGFQHADGRPQRTDCRLSACDGNGRRLLGDRDRGNHAPH
jgi:type IV secretion system protein VirD4